MEKPCYRTFNAFMEARQKTNRIIKILDKSRSAILMLTTKMPDYWHDSHGDNIKMELVCDLEHLIKDLQDESD
mgnify:CR=1 FL=1|tara:strand:+ start:198 stop:416 length:219 start_codon:yes stop_codon:yes gene_type:complete